MEKRNKLIDSLVIVVLLLAITMQVSGIVQRTEINKLTKEGLKLNIEKLKIDLKEN